MSKRNIVKPVRRTRLYDQIIAQIQQLVSDGRVKPGDQLPPERELADQLGVSRGSLREALRTLEYLGFIESRPGGGTIVQKVELATILSPFADFLSREEQFLLETMEFRLIVEPSVARLCAINCSDEVLVKIRRALKRHEDDVRDSRPALDSDTAFHLAIAEGSGNDFICQFVKAISGILGDWRRMWLKGRPATSIEHHQRIFDAINSRDADKAEAAMREHLENILGIMRDVLGESQAAGSHSAWDTHSREVIRAKHIEGEHLDGLSFPAIGRL